MQTRDKTDKSRSVAETIGHSHVYSSFLSLHREKEGNLFAEVKMTMMFRSPSLSFAGAARFV